MNSYKNELIFICKSTYCFSIVKVITISKHVVKQIKLTYKNLLIGYYKLLCKAHLLEGCRRGQRCYYL